MKRLLLEASWLLVVGVAVSLVANQLSPRGLSLTRNYFPNSAVLSGSPSSEQASPVFSAPSSSNSEPASPVLERLLRKGLQPATHSAVVQYFNAPDRAAGSVVFVDARDDSHFQAGHIPGAFQLDSYRMERYLAEVLPVCLTAATVIVYCSGGECEDSESTAILLSQAGVPLNRIFVYAGGMAEWNRHSLPVESGPRNSGQLKSQQP